MVQRKTCQATESYNLQPETRFGQEHLKNLGPEMMMMKKRTKPKRKVKDSSVFPSGKTQSPPKKHDLVVKGTGRSPNYMKGTTCSEARIENKKRFNQTGMKHVEAKKERCNNKPSSRTVRGLTKAPSFKRCSQRATCSSTLKDSKFPEYLILNHGGTDDDKVSGTSVLRVCPYTYCSLNGHMHKQYPPWKSFISSRRQSLKSQKSVKMEASKEDSVEVYVEEKKECEDANGGAFEDTQISETFSEGAPRSETDSDDYSDSADMVKLLEGDDGSDFEDTCEVDDDSDSVEMVRVSEGDHEFELRESSVEEALVDDCVKEIQEKAKIEEDVTGEEILKDNKTKDSKEESQDQTEAVPMLEETAKVTFKGKERPCNQEEESDATVSWTTTKCKKLAAETEDLREFNPREPNYLPVVVDVDTEKVGLKHQDMDERKNSEDWMFDYALQRTVTKLSSARKRKVALLVEAFETVKPVMEHGRESAPVLCYGRHLQTCN